MNVFGMEVNDYPLKPIVNLNKKTKPKRQPGILDIAHEIHKKKPAVIKLFKKIKHEFD